MAFFVDNDIAHIILDFKVVLTIISDEIEEIRNIEDSVI